MPFVAECILCRQKVRLPDRSFGASVQCPRCGSHFTAAPEHDVIPSARRNDPHPLAAANAPAATAIQPAPPQSPASTASAPAAATQSAPLLIPLATARPGQPLRRIDPIGVGAMAVCIAALACVWFYALCALVIPLAVVGLVTGLVALAVGLLSDRPRYILASISCVANAAVLFAGLFYPSMLGPTFEMSRARSEGEIVIPRPVPLAGHKLAPGDENTEWPDASRLALQVKKVRIQIVGAVVRPLEIAQTPKKRVTKESYLVLRVRIHQPAGGAEFASDRWGQPGTAQERRQPVVTDNTGKVYKAPASNIGGEAGQLSQHSSEFPLGITDEVFVFDAPAPEVRYLRLEMSSTAWGGTGAIRFTIPRGMVQFEPSPMGKEKS
jgi:hypothetical protein